MIFTRPCLSCGRLVRGRSRCAECEGQAYTSSALTPSGSRWAWSRLRAAVLKAEPWCRMCRARGKYTRAVTVDHVVQRVDGGSDHPSNLTPLCDDCHKAKGRGDGSQRIVRGTAGDPAPLPAPFMNLAFGVSG